MVREIVESAGGGQLLADLRYRRVGRIAPRPPHTYEAAVACVEMGGHLAVIAVLAQFESHIPMLLSRCHTINSAPSPVRDVRALRHALLTRRTKTDVASSGFSNHVPSCGDIG